MMKVRPTKLAFYVEGQTEVILLERIVREYVGAEHVHFEIYVMRSGRGTMRPTDGMEHAPVHVLIYDCGNDHQVITEVQDAFDRLSNAGYGHVVAVRDLHPSPLTEAAQVRHEMSEAFARLATFATAVYPVLFVHQVEAAFFADVNHFGQLFSAFDVSCLDSILGGGWRDRSPEEIERPASKLEQLYRGCGSMYDKSESVVRKAVGKLDIASLAYARSTRLNALASIFGVLDSVFVSDAPQPSAVLP